jgi:hypothetical protein
LREVKTIALAWAPFGHRLDELSAALGGKRVNITLLYGPRYFAPIRYLALFFRTLILLWSESPDVVLAQNPPIFCPISALLYCKLAGRRLLVDHHSIWRLKTIGGGLVGKAIGFLETFVALSSEANTVPHSVWAKELSRMGGNRVFVVHDFVDKNPCQRDLALRDRYGGGRMVAIASHGGHPLERVETEVEAASKFPGLLLLVTGPPSKLAARLKSTPPNVEYLGLLPMDDYLKLKASCDFAINITDEPFTLSHVLFEYAASSLPAVSTRSEVVENTFGEALLYSRSSAVEHVVDALLPFVDEPEVLAKYRSRIEGKFVELSAAREKEIDLLISVATGIRPK